MAGQQLEKQAPQTIEQMLVKNRVKIERLCGQALDIHRFVTVVTMCLARNPKLRECTPVSLYRACMQSAELGLYPGGIDGDAYFVPFRNTRQNVTEVTLIPGYKGFVRLGLLEPTISKIVARAVFKTDDFDYSYGTDEYIRHKPSGASDPAELTHAYVIVTLDNGEQIFDVMSREEIDKIRARARAKDDGPWVTDFVAMAIKCPIRRNAKFWPRTRGVNVLQKALAHENAVDTGDWSLAQYEIEEAQPAEAQQTAAEERVQTAKQNMRKERKETNLADQKPAAAPAEEADLPLAQRWARNYKAAGLPADIVSQAKIESQILGIPDLKPDRELSDEQYSKLLAELPAFVERYSKFKADQAKKDDGTLGLDVPAAATAGHGSH